MKHKVLFAAALLTGCALDRATIKVDADEPVESARLVLNGEEIEVKRESSKSFVSTWSGGEASGELAVIMKYGTEVVCSVGYIEGSAFYREEFAISNRRCELLP